MYENDGMLIRYFKSVENVDDIEKYGEKESLTRELSEVLERMSGEKVMQVWVADEKTDNYLFSSGYRESRYGRSGMVRDGDGKPGTYSIGPLSGCFFRGDGDIGCGSRLFR